jgi:hypothetical protein
LSNFFGEERRTINIFLNDPPGVKNYYRYTLSINDERSKSVFVYDDSFNDGRKVVRELFDFDLNAMPGDKIEVQMQCISAAVFRYWQGVEQNESRGGASTTPANPVSNISNGALGYFSAHTKQDEMAVVPN